MDEKIDIVVKPEILICRVCYKTISVRGPKDNSDEPVKTSFSVCSKNCFESEGIR